MNTANAVRARYENLRSIAAASIPASPTFTLIGSLFANPVRILKVTNLTNANVIISVDGTNAVDVVAANGFYLYDFGSDRSETGGNLEEPEGDGIYVQLESAAATTGFLYVTVIYASIN